MKADFLQRTRSYNFLITLCATVALAYTFIPEPNANYVTIFISGHQGIYNSAWFGYVTATMTSIFLPFVGFFLVNGSIAKDEQLKVGQMIAASPISNFKYILSKATGNFLLLFSIALFVFVTSIFLFFLYNGGYSFELKHFITPYLYVVLPALVFTALIAVVFELVFRRYTVIQNAVFFFSFTTILTLNFGVSSSTLMDLTGSRIIIQEMEETVANLAPDNTIANMTSIGYFKKSNFDKSSVFQFNGVDFPSAFVLSRIGWITFFFILLSFVSLLFKRFINEKIKFSEPTTVAVSIMQNKIAQRYFIPLGTSLSLNYSILPLIKMEMLLLLRKNNKWLWMLTIIGMIMLGVLPVLLCIQIILPVLWFIQVHCIADLTSKEIRNNTAAITGCSYMPIMRLLNAQIISATIFMICVAFPLIVRYCTLLDFKAAIVFISGAFFIVIFAAFLGVLFASHKTFEVLFFMITYANINNIAFADYYSTQHDYYQFFIIFSFVLLILLYLMKANFFVDIRKPLSTYYP
ncbi:MAG: hypothetical protein V3V14_13950, partial [Saprospiraceae bacterium]